MGRTFVTYSETKCQWRFSKTNKLTTWTWVQKGQLSCQTQIGTWMYKKIEIALMISISWNVKASDSGLENACKMSYRSNNSKLLNTARKTFFIPTWQLQYGLYWVGHPFRHSTRHRPESLRLAMYYKQHMRIAWWLYSLRQCSFSGCRASSDAKGNCTFCIIKWAKNGDNKLGNIAIRLHGETHPLKGLLQRSSTSCHGQRDRLS